MIVKRANTVLLLLENSFHLEDLLKGSQESQWSTNHILKTTVVDDSFWRLQGCWIELVLKLETRQKIKENPDIGNLGFPTVVGLLTKLKSLNSLNRKSLINTYVLLDLLLQLQASKTEKTFKGSLHVIIAFLQLSLSSWGYVQLHCQPHTYAHHSGDGS